MKKQALMLALLVLLLALWPVAPARAAGVTLDVEPGATYLQAAQQIPFTFTIVNDLPHKITDIRIYAGADPATGSLVYQTPSTLSANGARGVDTFTYTAQPGVDMVFTLTYTYTQEDGTTASGQASDTVRVEMAVRRVTLQRTASATQVMKGDRVEFTYTVKNEGNLPVDWLQLSDSAVTSGLIVDQALDVGQTVTKTVAVTAQRSLVSRPKVTYRFLGATYTEQELVSPLSLTVAEPVLTLEAQLTTDVTQVYQSQPVDCQVTLTNTGNVRYGLISLYDSEGNALGGIDSLAAGDSRTVPVSIVPPGTGFIQVTAVVQVSEGGPQFSVKTNRKSIVVLLGTPAPSPSPEPTATALPTPTASPTPTPAPAVTLAPTMAPQLTDVPIVEVPPVVGRSLLTLFLVILFILLAAIVVIMVVIIRRSQAEAAGPDTEDPGFFALLRAKLTRSAPADSRPGARPSGPPARSGSRRSGSSRTGAYVGGSATPPAKPVRPGSPDAGPSAANGGGASATPPPAKPAADSQSHSGAAAFWQGSRPMANPYTAPAEEPAPPPEEEPVLDEDTRPYVFRHSDAMKAEDFLPPDEPPEPPPAGRPAPRHGKGR